MFRFCKLGKLTQKISTFVLIISLISGCAFYPQSPSYKGPPDRPATVDQYYDRGRSFGNSVEQILSHDNKYTLKRIFIDSDAGPLKIDYWALNKPSQDLIFVFPLLGGKNIIADYFAEYFAEQGYDTAVVHRVNDFKDPASFDNLEGILRKTLIRDRIAIDFFEQKYDKKNFGSFGISRGAINVAMTAGVDPRLKFNVMAMGGTELVNLFKRSDQGGIAKYTKKVMDAKNITRDQFYEELDKNIKTDPKYFAQFIDARNSLLFLSVFDKTVPIKYGERLRKQIGNPRTIYIAAGHYTSILFTQYVKLLLPLHSFCLFPSDYIETESLAFFNEKFQRRSGTMRLIPYRILQLPFEIIGRIFHS
jgi:hypothetical protein